MDNAYSGVFITIEGGEGTGKSTLINGLKSHFENQGQKVVVTREPGGTPTAEALRAILLQKSNTENAMTAWTEALIVSAARSDHVSNLIYPALMDGKTIICDRFYDSTLAYQGRDIGSEDLMDLIQVSTSQLSPDLTLLLDGNPQRLLTRRTQRTNNQDRFEDMDLAFHEEVRVRFLDIASKFPERIVTLNAERSADEVLATAISHIDGLKRTKGHDS